MSIRVNAPPGVSLASPSNGAAYSAPANILLAASASDPDGSLAKVEFYQGSTLIATLTAAPYHYTWPNVAPGSYRITAVATDTDGAMTASAPASITVTSGVAQMYFVHADHLGTPRLIPDETQKTVWRWDNQEPFGNDVPNADPNSTGNSFEFPLRFPGQYFDRETNLAYNMARDYSADIGRYVESDPIELKGGMNTYTYVSGNPIRFIDLAGLVKWHGTNWTGAVGPWDFLETFDLISECKCGREVHTRVEASGVSYGKGVTWAGSTVALEDPFDCPSAENLVGEFMKISAGLAFIVGGQYSLIVLGAAVSPGGFGWEQGFDFSLGRGVFPSAGVTFGRSNLVWNFDVPCGCETRKRARKCLGP